MKSAMSAATLAAVLAAQIGMAQAAEPLNWYRCNTHTHTSAKPGSDANGTPDFVARWYREHGYQCVVITDHENLTDVEPLNRAYGKDGKFLVLRGQEITQQVADPSIPGGRRHAHVNGINIDKAIMPVGYPQPATGALLPTYEHNLAAIAEAGGIAQVNHPNLMWSVTADDLLPITQPYLLEVWNAFPTSNNLGGTDDAGHVSPSAEALWDTLLTHGRKVWAVASDDVHEYARLDDREAPTPGKAWVVIQAPSLTVANVTAALRDGHFYASTGIALEIYTADRSGISLRIAPPKEWSPAMKPTARYLTRFIGPSGRVLAEVAGAAPTYRFKGDESYVRASLIDSDGRRAWTQPVFLR
jgi:hypothetical protein